MRDHARMSGADRVYVLRGEFEGKTGTVLERTVVTGKHGPLTFLQVELDERPGEPVRLIAEDTEHDDGDPPSERA
jgi:hypothetical protein